jgi:hypothetical protein
MRKLLLLAALLASCSPAKPPPKLEALSTPEGFPRSKTIAKGTSYLPSDYLLPGYVTVLAFGADW